MTNRTNRLTPTFWNGERCEARRITAVVADEPQARGYWARQHVGERRNAVEVIYSGQTFYLDDDDFEPLPDSDYAKAMAELLTRLDAEDQEREHHYTYEAEPA